MPGSTLIFIILLSVLLGAAVAYLILRLRLQGTHLPLTTVDRDYVRQEVHAEVTRQADQNYANYREKADAENALGQQLAALRAELTAAHQRLQQQGAEMERLQAASLAAFERTADRLFQEKSQRFTHQNAQQLDQVLKPLRERIAGFEQAANQRFTEETRDRVSLREELKNLQRLNQQVSQEANNLAGALRGSSKTQGDWGEWQLLTLLEASGLERGVHFRDQASFRDEEGRQKRPDFIVHLPEGKHLVIDSKVSLTAYDRYHALAEHDPERSLQAAAHCKSLHQHVLDLASKNYTRLHQISSPDYLLLFVPIEPAFALALQTDQSIFLQALERNVVIVTPSTLLATLRTVSFIWKQDKQKRNVLEIAEQAGRLYDGFVSFTDELKGVGKQIERAQQGYDAALRKLSTGGTYGKTLVGRAERLRKLGAKTKKRLGPELLREEE